jgi:hypothetical protein
MPHSLPSAEYWHAKAEEARAQGDNMRSEDARKAMFSIADSYEAMAARAAKREARGKPDAGKAH